MDSFRSTLLILLIRGIAAIGLLIIGIYNLVEGETALGVLWIALALVFAYMAYRRMQAVRTQGPPPRRDGER